MIGIVHAPGHPKRKLNQLKLIMYNAAKSIGLEYSELLINPEAVSLDKHVLRNINIVILGCCDPVVYHWNTVLAMYKLEFVQCLLCLQLCDEHTHFDAMVSSNMRRRGDYWGEKVQRGQQLLFSEGYYVGSSEPYGLKKVSVRKYDAVSGVKTRCLLVPGDPQKVEIVRLIFNLYVNAEHSLSDISNLLSAQRISSPGYNEPWTWGNVKRILGNYFYIGANKLGKAIMYDVFVPVLDKPLFFEAQATLHREFVSKTTVMIQGV